MNLTQLGFTCSSLLMQALWSIWADGIKAVALREPYLHFAHHSCFLVFFFISMDFWACCSLLSWKILSTIEDIHGNMTLCSQVLMTWFSDSVRLTVELDLQGIFQLQWFYDALSPSLFFFKLCIFNLHHSKLCPNTAYLCKRQVLSLLALAMSNSEQCRKCHILWGWLWFQELCPRWALTQLIFKLY